MPNLKISALTGGGAAQAADEFVVARSGGNNKITGANVAAAATSVGTLTSLNVSGTATLGAATVTGAATFNGNTTIGDATSDTVTFTARANSDLVPSTDNARDLGTSALKWRTVFATTFTENGAALVAQTDIGSAANEIPLNQMLGQLAFVDDLFFPIAAGTGITTGVGTVYSGSVYVQNGLKRVNILIDLTGLNSGGAAGDIIGVNGTALPCHIGQLPSMTVLGGRMTCLETPAGGDTDLDLFAATVGTGVEDQAISALSGQAQIINAGTQALGTVTYFSADPASSAFLYLVNQATGNSTYTAGRFLIEIFGV